MPLSNDFHVFKLQGKDVIGMRRTAEPQQLIGFIHVESTDATAERARQLGGRLPSAPVDTPGVARTCVLQDHEGATFGLWESRGHNGAQVQDVTGTMWWAEVLCRDIRAARAFYTRLFDWSFSETKKWNLTSQWRVVFAIDNWDKAVAQIDSTGGQVGFVRDVPNVGRLGAIRDPHGAAFLMMRPDVVAA